MPYILLTCLFIIKVHLTILIFSVCWEVCCDHLYCRNNFLNQVHLFHILHELRYLRWIKPFCSNHDSVCDTLSLGFQCIWHVTKASRMSSLDTLQALKEESGSMVDSNVSVTQNWKCETFINVFWIDLFTPDLRYTVALSFWFVNSRPVLNSWTLKLALVRWEELITILWHLSRLVAMDSLFQCLDNLYAIDLYYLCTLVTYMVVVSPLWACHKLHQNYSKIYWPELSIRSECFDMPWVLS